MIMSELDCRLKLVFKSTCSIISACSPCPSQSAKLSDNIDVNLIVEKRVSARADTTEVAATPMKMIKDSRTRSVAPLEYFR